MKTKETRTKTTKKNTGRMKLKRNKLWSIKRCKEQLRCGRNIIEGEIEKRARWRRKINEKLISHLDSRQRLLLNNIFLLTPFWSV